MAQSLGIPAAAAAELRRVARLAKPWIVADMDSTLIRKARGEWPGLRDSPVRPHLLTWLESGGSVLVVTSDDGHRPWRQLLGQIPAVLRRNVLLSTGDGAVLSRLDERGVFTEDLEYWRSANGGDTAGLPSTTEVVETACELKRDFLVDAMSDPSLLQTVSPDWRLEGYRALLGRFQCPTELREYLTMERMLGMNVAIPRGSLVWCNEAGEPDFWEIEDDREWRAKLEAKRNEIAKADAKAADERRRLTNCFVLGMSSDVSKPYLERHASRLTALGALASAAPNSVLIKHAAANKALPVRWLTKHQKLGFSCAAAVAFGDNPAGNDAPLASFMDDGMPFVSVAPGLEHCPAHLQPWHVGGLEEGTALCMALMNEARLGVGSPL